MKHKLLFIIFAFSTSCVIAQSKKEIIETLNIHIDSLNMEIKNRDNKHEQDVISNSNYNQALLSEIKKQKHDIESTKIDFDSIQKKHIQLNENYLKLQKELVKLNDSISELNSKLSSYRVDKTSNLAEALKKVKSKWTYFMDDFADIKYIVKDSLNKICNDERCVSFLWTNGFLVVTYRINEVAEFDTQIIDLNSNQDLMSTSKIKVYVNDFDKENSILKISNEGYDNNGRYWQFGTWSFKEKIMKLGKKEY